MRSYRKVNQKNNYLKRNHRTNLGRKIQQMVTKRNLRKSKMKRKLKKRKKNLMKIWMRNSSRSMMTKKWKKIQMMTKNLKMRKRKMRCRVKIAYQILRRNPNENSTWMRKGLRIAPSELRWVRVELKQLRERTLRKARTPANGNCGIKG